MPFRIRKIKRQNAENSKNKSDPGKSTFYKNIFEFLSQSDAE
jgi:hypothetical protein